LLKGLFLRLLVLSHQRLKFPFGLALNVITYPGVNDTKLKNNKIVFLHSKFIQNGATTFSIMTVGIMTFSIAIS